MDAKISFVGMGLGAVALLLALVHFWAGPFSPQPTLEDVVASKAVAIRNATIAAMKGQTPPRTSTTSDPMSMDKFLNIGTTVLGGVAVILGVLGYARKEPLRVAGGAAFLGAGAIAIQFFVIALGIIVMALLVSVVLSQIGIN